MRSYSNLLFDRGTLAKVGRPNINDLLFINTSFFNFFLSLFLTALMRSIPQANHLVFGQLEGQDPVYSTLLIGLATFFMMLIYTRQTYFYEDTVDQSSTFKVVNQVAFMLPLGIWFLAITFNYPGAHWRSILLCAVLLLLASSAITRTSTRYNIFKTAIREPQINKLILVSMTLIGLILLFYLIRYDEIPGKEHMPLWIGVFIVIVLSTTILIHYISRRRSKATNSGIVSVFSNSTANGIYIMMSVIVCLRLFGSYDKLGNGFDVVILFFLFVRMLLFCTGVLARYFANSKPIHFLNIKFVTLLFIFYLIGMLTRPGKGREHYRLDVVPSSGQKISLDQYIDQWIKTKPADDASPIYLISGQGGGSRAGCAFFTTMSLLDSLIHQNTLAITTVSGSSNGAGFYLGVKKAIPESSTYQQIIPNQDTLRIRTIDSILYHKDYITNSLFKLLFTDYARSLLGYEGPAKSRNLALLGEERDAYKEVSEYLQLRPVTLLDSTWSSMYADRGGYRLPLFLPLTYNIEYGIKAIHSPVQLPEASMHPFFAVLDSLGEKRDLQINRSILTSQMFPIISASASIDSFHYLDAGVYDNLAYETLFDLYQIVAGKRDSLATHRPIILLAVINGNYEADLKFNQIGSELDAVSHALSQSLFSSNPLVHKAEGLLKMNQQKDRFFELKVFRQGLPQNALSFSEKLLNFFKYTPLKDKVVISRYLTMNDIRDNIMYSAYKEVDSLKVDLDKFLNQKR